MAPPACSTKASLGVGDGGAARPPVVLCYPAALASLASYVPTLQLFF